MDTVEIKNKFDVLLKKLSTERSFDIAEKISAELVGLINIKVKDRFLLNIPRVDAELTRFQLAPGFARQAAAYELPHEDNKPIDLKLFWVKKTSKTNLSWLIGLTPNFEDALSNDYKNIGIDFVVPETCDSVIVLLSNRFKIRALELKDHITPTQLEIFAQWAKLSDLAITDQNELKSTLHTKLWESFNFEPVNRKFYLELVEHFSILVHHLEKDLGRKPSVMFTTRLIGRLLFIWFLKKKSLVNDKVDYFSIANIEKQKEYYENKLEKLFFEVLNREELERDNGDKLTPYLNGGLFDKNTTDFYNDPKLTFPNGYFNQLFTTLNKYNFTVDESSPEFQHVAIDPEMLGRIFESLLAEQIDENTGNSKKKATGAFYTPREVVSYMCEQSLIEHLKTKVPETPDRDRRIEELVRMPEAIFRDQDQNKRRDWKPYREAIIKALEGSKTESPLTVLDPAVGSGAFPMGMLHLLVKVYSRLDPKFEKDISGLKRDILSRSLYGVDIEQTAVEITRLRAWLSIIVDIPEGEKVEPLPNLEFKFVCANTLIPLDNTEQATFFTDHDLKDKLITIRDDYFKTSSKVKKEKLQKNYLKLTQNSSLFDNKKTQQLKSYKPFDTSSSSEFYDPELMHGVQIFDVVIGNPPYISALVASKIIDKKTRDFYKEQYISAKGTYDIYLLFFEKGLSHLKENGILIYITPTKYLSANYAQSFRKDVGLKKVKTLIDFSQSRVFESAGVSTFVSIFSNKIVKEEVVTYIFDQALDFSRPKVIYNPRESLSIFPESLWGHLITGNFELLKKIYLGSRILGGGFSVNGSSTAGEADDYCKFISAESGGKKIINTGTIAPYVSLWGIKEYSNKKTKILRPYLKVDNISERRREMYDTKKIIIPKLCKKLYATIDTDGEFASTNTTFIYNLDKISVKVIGALINSNLYNFIYKNIFSGLNLLGSFQVQAPQVRLLPYRDVEKDSSLEFIRILEQIISIKKQNPETDTKDLESQIDHLIYKLFDLTLEEVEIVENSSKN